MVKGQIKTTPCYKATTPKHVPSKYQIPTPYSFCDTAQTNFSHCLNAHPNTMDENNTQTALKGCGVKSNKCFWKR